GERVMADQVNDSAASTNPKEPQEAPQAPVLPEANHKFFQSLLTEHEDRSYGNAPDLAPGDPIRIDQQLGNHIPKHRCEMTVTVSTTDQGQFTLELKNALYPPSVRRLHRQRRDLIYGTHKGDRANLYMELNFQQTDVISEFIDALNEFQGDVSGKDPLLWAVANTTIDALERLKSCMEECTP
ncbi:MAG: hypothetical protein RIC12_00325, partial [Pirellulales bacterium]